MTTAAATPAAGSCRPCNRCKEHEGTIDLRGAERVCQTCFAYYVSSKAIKRLEVLQRKEATAGSQQQRGSQGRDRRPQRYLVALSRGPSSTALLHVLTENVRQQRARGMTVARFEYVAVHVVVDEGEMEREKEKEEGEKEDILSPYRAHFPEAELLTVPLSSALQLSSVDWTTLPPRDDSLPPAQQLQDILRRLPSATSRADIQRLLVRHVLVAAAAEQRCDALLLGHSTTSLAELTLSETAKGRGFSLPGLVNDGVVPVTVPVPVPDSKNGDSDSGSPHSPATNTTRTLPIYSPLRELFRKELLTYLSLADPPLPPPLFASSSGGNSGKIGGAVISHRDLSIDDVLARYFADVETSYPSVVANVVRTTGKLSRRPDGAPASSSSSLPTPPASVAAGGNGKEEKGGGEGRRCCGLCAAALDEQGDERWRGEIGGGVEEEEEEEEEDAVEENGEGEDNKTIKKRRKRLCYGCERSVRG